MMKKMLLSAVVLCGGALCAEAQDRIVKRDASEVEALVLEIAPDAVRYKRFSNPEGPTYVLPASEIDFIRFANGETECFATPAAEAAVDSGRKETVAAAAGEPVLAAPAARADAEWVVKEWKIGDYYERGGVKGVVCALTDEGTHGLILSLEEIYLPWSRFRKSEQRATGAADAADGRVNMEAVERFIADNGLSWDDFPAFKWCREQGDGWYLPAIDELLVVGHNYNGGSRSSNNRQARNRFNDALKSHGGDRMDRMVYYYSSTERNDRDAMTSHTGIEPPFLVDIPKGGKFLVRAVRRF